MSMIPKHEIQRSMQCDRRGFNTCGMIRQRLQFLHVVTIKECDECWKLGGPMSVSAARWREGYCRKVINTIADRDPKTVSIPAVLTVMGMHMPREKAAAKLEEIAVRIGEKRATVLAAKYGGSELVDRIAAQFDGMDAGERSGEIRPLQQWGWLPCPWRPLYGKPWKVVLYWEGVPALKRPWICGKHAAKAFIESWRGLRRTGCGCVSKAKEAARRAARKAKELAG